MIKKNAHILFNPKPTYFESQIWDLDNKIDKRCNKKLIFNDLTKFDSDNETNLDNSFDFNLNITKKWAEIEYNNIQDKNDNLLPILPIKHKKRNPLLRK